MSQPSAPRAFTVPDRDEFRRDFDQAVADLLEKELTNPNLTQPWYSRVGDSVFDACYLALEDACQRKTAKGFPGTPYASSGPRLHVVSAPVGSGKTSFSEAVIVAVVRLAERNDNAPYGCLVVVDQIARAEQIYRDLNALIPGKVAVWSTEHDPDCKAREKVPNPAAVYTKDQLKNYPVAIVTHSFFNGKGSYKAREVLNKTGEFKLRALTIIDEQIDGVTIYDIEPLAVQLVQKQLQHDETIRPHLDALVEFVNNRSDAGGGSLEKPTAVEAWTRAEQKLKWFNTPAAATYAQSSGDSNVVAVFGFAKALVNGYVFINRQQGTHFIGYKNNLAINPGTVLLDATSDIDGISQLCPWREHQEVPRARYDNLQIVHVPPHTKKRLSQYLKGYKNRKAYVDWMVDVIKEHVAPGQKALVVCKKILFDNQNVPDWPEKDERHIDTSLFTRGWGWDIGGRKLCAIHWGMGIGDNNWNGADVVLLFDEFWLPRRIVIATAQGLRGHKAHEGDLGHMRAMNSKAPGVDTLQDGHRLRWTKQMALRGRGRSYDAQGVCGHQKLVCCGDFRQLLTHSSELFPGAQITIISPNDSKQTQADALLAILSRPDLPPKLTQSWIGQQLKTPWRDVSKNIMPLDHVQKSIKTLGWRYVPRRGRGGSYFERIEGDTRKKMAA
jgi:hypothetical protein